MAMLRLWSWDDPWDVLLDPILLAVISSPFLYLFIIAPIENALKKLRETEEVFRGIYNQSPIGIEVYDKNGIDSFLECQSRDYIKEYYSEAIDLVDMKDLLRLDNLYCTEKIG